jgi:hypothetical protein
VDLKIDYLPKVVYAKKKQTIRVRLSANKQPARHLKTHISHIIYSKLDNYAQTIIEQLLIFDKLDIP